MSAIKGVEGVKKFTDIFRDTQTLFKVGYDSFTGLTKAIYSTATAFKEATTKGEKFKAVLNGIKTGMEGMSTGGKIALFAIAIGIFTKAMQYVMDASNRAEEESSKVAEASKQSVSNIEQQQDSLNSLVAQYKSLAAQSKADLSVKTELISVQEQINKLVGGEIDGLDLVNGKLDEQLAKIREKARINASENNTAYSKATQNTIKAAENTTMYDGRGFDMEKTLRLRVVDVYDKNGNNDAMTGVSNAFKKALEDADINVTYTLEADNTSTNDFALPDDVLKRYEAIKKIVQWLKENGYTAGEVWDKFTDAEIRLKKAIDGVVDSASKEVNNVLLGSDNMSSNVKTVEDYVNMRDKLIEEVKQSPGITDALDKGYVDEDWVNQTVDNYLSGLEQYSDVYNEWWNRFGSDAAKGVEELKKKLQSEDFNTWIDGLDYKDRDLVYEISLKTDTAKWQLNDWQKALKDAKASVEESESLLPKIFSSKGSEDSDTFSARIKTYRENINSLTEALEKYKKGELDEDTYHGLVEKFPQLAGRTKDLDVAITELMDDMDSDMVSDFDDQFGKLETQEDIDALKEYESQVLSTRKQNSAFAKSYGEIYDKIEAVRHQAERWNELTNGNVDYSKRPLVSPEKMREVYPEFDGEIATTYSQSYTIGEGQALYTIEITPILEDGTVWSEEAVQDYLDKLVTDKGVDGLLASDDLNLIMNVQPGDYDEAYWDDYQSKLGVVKETHWELIKQLQDETGLTWDEIVKKYGVAIDVATKFNSKIEETVSAFNTVKSVVNDYNENGFLSLENVQSILSLSDKYILALTNEQGALDLSTESYKRLVEAELLELKAQALQDSIDSVNKIENEAQALAYLEGSKTDATQASLSLADAQWQEALSAAAVKDIENGTGDLYQRTVIAARKAYETKIALIDKYAETAFTVGELSTATEDYTKALNKEKDALEDSKKALENQKKALEDTKQGYEDALSAVKDLVSWVQDYIKQIKNDEIDALEKKKETIDELIESQKELLDAEKEEYEWNKTISEEQNTVAKDALAASIASLDDSSAGRKAQKQANDKLAESRSDMLDTLYDHEIEIRKDALDKLKEEQDEYYDNLIDNIQDYLNNEVQLYKDACAMIDNDSGDLYGKLLWYCQNYTTTTEAEFNHMWNSAQSALQQYNTANLGTFELLNDLQGRIYEVDNAIDTISQSISSYESAIDGVQGKLDNLSQSAQKAISDIQAAANAEDEWTKPKWVYTWQDNDYKSWKVNRDAAISDIIKQIESRYGGVFPASAATIYGTIRKYASGTNSAAGGLSLVGEKGAEFRVLNPGDGIVKNKIVQGVTALGTNPAQFIADAGKKLLSSLFGNSIKPSFSAIGSGNNQPINIVNNIQGDVNPSTLKALVAAQKKIVQDAVKEMQIKSLSLRATNRI